MTLIVGQNGKHPKGIDKVGSGGSFVVIGNELLLAAGGAGAWNREYSHGSLSTNGRRSSEIDTDNTSASLGSTSFLVDTD